MIPYFLRVAYVGTDFFGWQIQTALRTVQGSLWQAVKAIDAHAAMPIGTSRTDAGVHANYQGVLVRLKKEWDCYRLLSAINAHLPYDIRVMAVKKVSEEFFPRAHVIAKRYIYYIQEGPSENPFFYNRQWHIFGSLPLDREHMQKAASFLIGTHDFSSFRHSECSATSAYKTIYDISIKELDNGFSITFDGNSFLMHMIRIIVGTLISVGKRRCSYDEVQDILAAKNRQRASSTAPPYGLYLDRIWYQDCWNIWEPSPWK